MSHVQTSNSKSTHTNIIEKKSTVPLIKIKQTCDKNYSISNNSSSDLSTPINSDDEYRSPRNQNFGENDPF